MKKSTFLLIGLQLLIQAFTAFGQTDKNFLAVTIKTQESINKLLVKAGSDSTSILAKDDIVQLSKNSTACLEKLKNYHGSDTLLLQSLQEMQKIIDSIRIKPFDESTSGTIQALAKDYKIKLKTSPHGVASTIVTRIEVFVVKKNNSPTGYIVYANYLWDFDSKKPRFLFNNPTNKASRLLAPGYYKIWLENDGRIIESRSVEIGNENTNKQKIEF